MPVTIFIPRQWSWNQLNRCCKTIVPRTLSVPAPLVYPVCGLHKRACIRWPFRMWKKVDPQIEERQVMMIQWVVHPSCLPMKLCTSWWRERERGDVHWFVEWGWWAPEWAYEQCNEWAEMRIYIYTYRSQLPVWSIPVRCMLSELECWILQFN